MSYYYPYTSSPPTPSMRLILVVPPDGEPLTAAEARARQNISSEVSDAVVEAYITAARQRLDGADGYLGRALMTQTWLANLDSFPSCEGGKIFVPLPPLQEVSEISYLDSEGLPVVIDAADYQVVQGARPYIMPAHGLTWPSVTTRADAISIVFVAGYGDDGENVPEPIRTAIALAAGSMNAMTTRNYAITEEVVEGVGSTRYAANTNARNDMETVIASLLSTYQVYWM